MGSDAQHDYDFIIVGAGPAGVQLSYFLSKTEKKYIVLEAGKTVGTFYKTFPRHRTLISINKIYNKFTDDEFNMRHDWNSLLSDDPEMRFTKYTKDLFPHTDFLCQYLQDFANHFKLNIKCNTRVAKVARDPKTKKFICRENNGVQYTAPVLVMATGAYGLNKPDIPGIELADDYINHSLNQEDYINKSLCIVGGGNTAFEVGDHLCGHAGFIHYFVREKVKFAWDTHYVGHLRAINNQTIDMYHLKSLAAFRACNIKEITKEINPENGKEQTCIHYDIELSNWSPPGTGHFKGFYDKVIFCTGWKYVNLDLYEDDVKPKLTEDGRLPVLDEMWQSSVEDMYFCGAPMHSRDKHAASGFIHGFRYNARVLFNMLMNKYHQVPLPKKVFSRFSLNDYAQHLQDRIGTTAALYQLNHAFLCDVFILKDNRKNKTIPDGETLEESDEITAEYYYELPTEWVMKQKKFFEGDLTLVFTMGDSRQMYREHINPTWFIGPYDMSINDNLCSAFAEPVFDFYKNGERVSQYHIGASIPVRFEIPQLPGGNPLKTFNKIKNWFIREMDLGVQKFDETFWDAKNKFHGYFTPLSKEELQGLREKKAAYLAEVESAISCDIRHYTG